MFTNNREKADNFFREITKVEIEQATMETMIKSC